MHCNVYRISGLFGNRRNGRGNYKIQVVARRSACGRPRFLLSILPLLDGPKLNRLFYTGASLGPARRIVDHWYGPFRDAINAAIRKMSNQGIGRTIVANLKLISSDKLPLITIQVVLGQLLGRAEGAPFIGVAMAVGRAVQAQINFEKMKAEVLK